MTKAYKNGIVMYIVIFVIKNKGEKMRKAVLLIHGFLSDKNDFAAILDNLHQYYNSVVSVRIPGHGDEVGISLFNEEGTFKAVLDAFDSLKDDYQIDVIGYSMGGCIAAYLAGIREFNKLVLLAPANKYVNFTFPLKLARVKRTLRRNIRKAKDEALVYLDRKEKMKVDHQFRLKMVRDRKSYFKFLPKYYLEFRRIIKKANKETKEIKNPCLIIWGEMDDVVPRRSINYIRMLCTNEDVRVVVFEEISHLLLLSPSYGDKVVTKIMEFLIEEV